MKQHNHHPLFLFVVSQHAARLALVGGLLKLAGHNTMTLCESAAVSNLLQKNPPDMVLADEALPEAERQALRAYGPSLPVRRSHPVPRILRANAGGGRPGDLRQREAGLLS